MASLEDKIVQQAVLWVLQCIYIRRRFAKFGLKRHEGKTRLLEFGRFAAERRQQRGDVRPETFDFLGFTHICDKTRSRGWFTVRRWFRSSVGRAKSMQSAAETRGHTRTISINSARNALA